MAPASTCSAPLASDAHGAVRNQPIALLALCAATLCVLHVAASPTVPIGLIVTILIWPQLILDDKTIVVATAVAGASTALPAAGVRAATLPSSVATTATSITSSATSAAITSAALCVEHRQQAERQLVQQINCRRNLAPRAL